jgi:hypothetical protein
LGKIQKYSKLFFGLKKKLRKNRTEGKNFKNLKNQQMESLLETKT